MILKRDVAKMEWSWPDTTRGRVAGEPCACYSSSSGIERRKGESQGPGEISSSYCCGYQNITNVFIKRPDQPVRLYSIYRLLMVASHRGVDVSWQDCAWVDSSFCTSWVGDTYRKAGCGYSLGAPDKQFILFADNLHGQTTDEFKSVIMQ